MDLTGGQKVGHLADHSVQPEILAHLLRRLLLQPENWLEVNLDVGHLVGHLEVQRAGRKVDQMVNEANRWKVPILLLRLLQPKSCLEENLVVGQMVDQRADQTADQMVAPREGCRAGQMAWNRQRLPLR